jgi:hypothetical protein
VPRWILKGACILLAGSALCRADLVVSEEAKPPKPSSSPPSAKPNSPNECGTRLRTYWAGSGPQVHVIRTGMLTEQKPLDPSISSEVRVLEVTISGKVATAYGPAFDAMRRGGPPRQLEEERGNAVKWDRDLASLPQTIEILSEDGPEIVARLRFIGCRASSSQARERDRPSRRGSDEARPREPAPTEDHGNTTATLALILLLQWRLKC